MVSGQGATTRFGSVTARPARFSVQISVRVTNPGASQSNVYCRWRPAGTTGWRTLSRTAATTTFFNIGGLSESTDYEYQIGLLPDFFRVTTIRTFTTLGTDDEITATLTRVSVITLDTSAAISASVRNAKATGTTVYFRWKPTLLNSWTSTVRSATLTSPTPSIRASGLSPSTTYDLQVSLSSSYTAGTGITISTTFTTDATTAAPFLSQVSVTDITENSAIIRATVANARAIGTAVFVRYRENQSGALWGRSATSISGSGGLRDVKQVTDSSPSTFFPLSGLSPGVYQYQVSLSANFAFATTRTFTTTRLTPTLGPHMIVTTDTTATISVEVMNPFATGTFVYFRHREKSATSWEVGTVRSAVPSNPTMVFELDGLDPGKTYEYQLSLDVNLHIAEIFEFMTGLTTSLGAPSATAQMTTAQISVEVINPKAVGSRVYARYRPKGDVSWINLTAQDATPSSDDPTTDNLTFNLSNLSAGTTYEYQVSLLLSYTGAVIYDFRTIVPPPEPTIVSVLSGTTVDTATLLVTVANSFATGTTVYARYKTFASNTWINLSAQDATPSNPVLTFDIDGLQPNTGYSYQVSLDSSYKTGVTAGGFTTKSRQVVLRNLGVRDITNTSAVLQFEVVEPFAVGNTIYTRYRRKGASVWINLSAQQATPTDTLKIWELTGLTPNTTYEYQGSLNLSYFEAPTFEFTTTDEAATLGTPVVETDFHSAQITVGVLNPLAVGSTVYGQYRFLGTTAWTAMSAQTATPDAPDVVFSVENLESSSTYEYQLSLNIGYAGAITRTFTTKVGAATLGIPTVEVTDTTATISVRVENAFVVGSRVYCHYRLQGDGDDAWINITAQDATPITPIVMFEATELTPNTNYEYQLSLTLSYPEDSPIYLFTTALPQPKFIDLMIMSDSEFADLQITVENPNPFGHEVVVRFKEALLETNVFKRTETQQARPDAATLFFRLMPLLPDTLYDVSIESEDIDTLVSSFETFPSKPTLGEPFATVAQTTATIFVSVNNSFAVGTPVYGRYREQDAMTWIRLSATQATPTLPQVNFPVEGLSTGTNYEYQLSLDLGLLQNAEVESVSGTFTTLAEVSTRPLNFPTGLGVAWSDTTAFVAWDELPGFDVTSYSLQYRVDGNVGWRILNGLTSNDVTIRGLQHSTTYEFQVSAFNNLGQGPWSPSVFSTSPTPPVERHGDSISVKFDHDGDGVIEDQADYLLAFTATWGGTGRGYLDRVSPATSQIIMDNSSNHFLLSEIRINTEVRIGINLGDQEFTLVGGYISDVSEDVDPVLGNKRMTITTQGIFWRLAQEDGATAIAIRDPFDALTSEVINSALATNNRVPVVDREIDHGQTRIYSINSPLVATSGLVQGNLMQVLNKIVLNEGGDLDEGRGLAVRFHSRFSRELTPGIDGRYFSDEYEGNRARIQFRTYHPDWYYNYIYTRVRAIQTAHSPVAESGIYNKTFVEAARPVIAAGSVYTYEANLQTQPEARTLATVSQALDWVRIDPSGIQLESVAADGTVTDVSQAAISVEPGVPSVPSDIYISDFEETPSTYKFKIANRTGNQLRIKQVSLAGTGIQRLSDFPVELENPDAIRAYNVQRTLDLGQMYAGAEYNGSTISDSSTAYALYLLRKYSRPRQLATIEFDHDILYPGEDPGPGRWGLAAQLAATLLPGDVINMASRNLREELPPGTWFVEGGGFQYEASTARLNCTLNISRRGVLPTLLTNTRLGVTAGATAPVSTGFSITLRAGLVYIIVVDCSFPAEAAQSQDTWDADDAVIELASGQGPGRTRYRVWLERDIPVGQTGVVSAIMSRDVDTTVHLNTKLSDGEGAPVTVERVRVWEMENVT